MVDKTGICISLMVRVVRKWVCVHPETHFLWSPEELQTAKVSWYIDRYWAFYKHTPEYNEAANEFCQKIVTYFRKHCTK